MYSLRCDSNFRTQVYDCHTCQSWEANPARPKLTPLGIGSAVSPTQRRPDFDAACAQFPFWEGRLFLFTLSYLCRNVSQGEIRSPVINAHAQRQFSICRRTHSPRQHPLLRTRIFNRGSAIRNRRNSTPTKHRALSNRHERDAFFARQSSSSGPPRISFRGGLCGWRERLGCRGVRWRGAFCRGRG